MKIGFYSQSFMTVGKYWQILKDKADCWWGVPDKSLRDLLNKKNIKNVFFFEEKYKKNFDINNGNMFKSIDPVEAQKKIEENINPDLWIVDSPNKLNFISNGALRVQTFHSVPIKKYAFYEPVLNYDLILLPGQYHKDQFIKRFNLDENDERLKIVGWPRVDDLVNRKYDRKKIMLENGLDPKKKTVMYAPTWGWGHGNSALFARDLGDEIKIFEKLCKKIYEKELNFIVRLHSLSFLTDRKEFIDIANKYKVVWQTTFTSNFRNDPNEFLWITDILISDLSGIITEFMVLDRPIIYIEPNENPSPWIDSDMPKNFRAGHIVKCIDTLIDSINDSIINPEKFSKNRKELLKKIFFNLDGKSSHRACEAILSFAKKNGLK